MFSLGLFVAQQCPAQITHIRASSKIVINGDSGDNRVEIVRLRYGVYRVELRRDTGVWETRNVYDSNPELYIDCDLGRGSNFFSNKSSLETIIEVSGNGNNTILCGDGADFYSSHGNSRDFILSGGGNDYISPGEGRDWVFGEDGNDIIFDSDLSSHLSFFGVPSQRGDGDFDLLVGGRGMDTFFSGSEDRISDLTTEDDVR